MPLSSWFSNLTTALTASRDTTRDQVRTSDAILTELSYQIRLAEEREQAAEREKKRAEMGGIDYSWLVTVKPKPYEVPEIERLELEELCGQVEPKECSAIIRAFREILVRPRKPQELSGILHAVIRQLLDVRPAQSTSTGVPQWLSKSLMSLKSLHLNLRNNSVSAVGGLEPDMEKQERSPSVELSTMRSFLV